MDMEGQFLTALPADLVLSTPATAEYYKYVSDIGINYVLMKSKAHYPY
jgi:hypothetical protein